MCPKCGPHVCAVSVGAAWLLEPHLKAPPKHTHRALRSERPSTWQWCKGRRLPMAPCPNPRQIAETGITALQNPHTSGPRQRPTNNRAKASYEHRSMCLAAWLCLDRPIATWLEHMQMRSTYTPPRTHTASFHALHARSGKSIEVVPCFANASTLRHMAWGGCASGASERAPSECVANLFYTRRRCSVTVILRMHPSHTLRHDAIFAVASLTRFGLGLRAPLPLPEGHVLGG